MNGGADLEALLTGRLRGVLSPWKIDGTAATAGWSDLCQPPDGMDDTPGSRYQQRIAALRQELADRQACLYAGKQYSLLLIFQAFDAAGKDGAIREVLEGLDVNGIRVTAFKRPAAIEIAHDFLWRTSLELPERGCIGVFNRSYYEEVLAVRVHPEYLDAQYAGAPPAAEALWPERFRAIREHERHLAVANCVILKFWLNVSVERQARRLLDRIEDPSRHWKYSAHDIVDSRNRPAYHAAMQEMIRETARPWAPWFVIPADDRWYLRWQIADILLQTLKALPLAYPAADVLDPEELAAFSRELRERMKNAAD